jgi:hypothetical protein
MNNVDYLFMAETRLADVCRYTPDSSEVLRLGKAVADIQGKFTSEEHIEYTKRKNTTETPDAKAKRIKAELKAMENNVDSQSI